MRKLNIIPNYIETADGSALIEMGKTRIICTASIEEKVPPFLIGESQGWITAEYEMLPASVPEGRKKRSRSSIDGRSVEIQRLIGRALRMACDLEKLGEKTIFIDCDVIQADGGTRCASINGGFVALVIALNKLFGKDIPLKNMLAAISVGIVKNKIVVDLDYKKDSTAEMDMNIVMTEDKEIIEIQGTAELQPCKLDILNQMIEVAFKDITKIIKYQRKILKEIGIKI